jgi:hypothetical protein
MLPVIAYTLSQSIVLLANGSRLRADKVILLDALIAQFKIA